jgi:hypothetical protein
MEASVYDQTPLSEQKSVSGVPTVLFVNKEGRITEAQEPRNRNVMATAVTKGVSEKEAATEAVSGDNLVRAVTELEGDEEITSVPTPASTPIVGTEMPAGTEIRPNPLNVLPAQPVRSSGVQYGGNPWAAFLQAAAQAAPAAVLAGAYAISKARRRTVRSSGLPAAIRRRSRSRRH